MSNTREDKTVEIAETVESESYAISGTPEQVRLMNMFIAHNARWGLSVFNSFLPQTQLNQLLAGILGTSPLVTTCLTQIPMARKISRDGGKNSVLIMIGCALTGMVSLIVLSSATNIEEIKDFDLRFVVMLVSGLLLGAGAGVYPLLINSLKWVRLIKQISTTQSLYSAVVNASSILTPILISLLSKNYGYPAAFGLGAGFIAMGGLAAIRFIQPPPYEQLLKQFPTDKKRAKKLALKSGQLEIMIQDNVNNSTLAFMKENIRLCIDLRGSILYLTSMCTLGSSFVTATVFPTLLKSGYHIDSTTAVYASAIANLITILARPVAGKIIAKYDIDSGGLKVFLAGCAFIIGSAIQLTFSNLQQWQVYTSTAVMNVGFAFTMMPQLSIAYRWAKPKNEGFKDFNPDIVFGGLGTSGTLGGLLLPIALGLLVKSQGEAGYQQYFFIIIAMMLAAAIAIPIVDFTVMHTKKEHKGFFATAMTLFGRNRNQENPSDDVELERTPLQLQLQRTAPT